MRFAVAVCAGWPAKMNPILFRSLAPARFFRISENFDLTINICSTYPRCVSDTGTSGSLCGIFFSTPNRLQFPIRISFSSSRRESCIGAAMDEEDRPPFAISSNSAENTPKESSVLPSASLDDKDEDEDDRNGDDHFKVDNPPSEDLAQATDLGSSSQSGSPQWTAAVTTTTTTTTTTSPNRRGSILRRSQARDDHLQRLCLKRHLKDELRQSIAVDPAGTATRLQTTTISQSIVVGSSDGSGVQISTSKVPAEWDHHAVQELRKEVETEFQHTEKHESAKIQELQNIAKDYNETLKGLDEFPLEVRVRNLTLTVLVDAAADAKINTVYNTSCLYPLLAAVRRWYQGESLRRPRLELQEKNLLSNINLILHPGKQYLVLGPPGSGKTTLLRSIAGQWHPPKGHRKEGTISYNGRTLEVRKALKHTANSCLSVCFSGD